MLIFTVEGLGITHQGSSAWFSLLIHYFLFFQVYEYSDDNEYYIDSFSEYIWSRAVWTGCVFGG